MEDARLLKVKEKARLQNIKEEARLKWNLQMEEARLQMVKEDEEEARLEMELQMVEQEEEVARLQAHKSGKFIFYNKPKLVAATPKDGALVEVGEENENAGEAKKKKARPGPDRGPSMVQTGLLPSRR